MINMPMPRCRSGSPETCAASINRGNESPQNNNSSRPLAARYPRRNCPAGTGASTSQSCKLRYRDPRDEGARERLGCQPAYHQRHPLHGPRCRHQRGRRHQPAGQERRLTRFGQTFVTKILLQEHFLKVGEPGISLSGTAFEQDAPGHLLGTVSVAERRVEIIEHRLTWRHSPERKNLSLVYHRRSLQWQRAAILHLNG